jgi:hypothetical protein
MAEFLILKEVAAGWWPTQVVQADTTAELREVVRQGYNGPGRYAVCRWDNRREFDLRPGQAEVADPPAS